MLYIFNLFLSREVTKFDKYHETSLSGAYAYEPQNDVVALRWLPTMCADVASMCSKTASMCANAPSMCSKAASMCTATASMCANTASMGSCVDSVR